MLYRVVCIDVFTGYRPVTDWKPSPKGLQITADVLNEDNNDCAVYFLEEAPLRVGRLEEVKAA